MLASAQLYPILREWLRPIADAMQLSAGSLEDMIQEVCLATLALKRPPCFGGENRMWQLRGWIGKVMRNKTVDALRHLRPGTVVLDTLAIEPAAPEEGETERKQHLWIREQLEGMAEDESLQARLLRGRFVDGRTNAELAAEEDLTEKAVERRICRKIAELRQKATEEGLPVPAQKGSSPGEKMRKK